MLRDGVFMETPPPQTLPEDSCLNAKIDRDESGFAKLHP
jgi:hypothetical protein